MQLLTTWWLLLCIFVHEEDFYNCYNNFKQLVDLLYTKTIKILSILNFYSSTFYSVHISPMEINIIIKILPKYVTADISPKPTVDMVTCQSTEINVSQ